MYYEGFSSTLIPLEPSGLPVVMRNTGGMLRLECGVEEPLGTFEDLLQALLSMVGMTAFPELEGGRAVR
jgi:hypothetical protein